VMQILPTRLMERGEALKTMAAVVAGMISAPDDASQTRQGRPQWQIDVHDYGAKGDGVTDDAPAIQGAIAASEAAGQGAVTFSPGTYKCTTGLRLAADRTSLVAPAGATLDFSQLSAGAALAVDATLTNINDAPQSNLRHQVRGLRILGRDDSGAVGVQLDSKRSFVGAFNFVDCATDGFLTGVRIGNNSWLNNFINCSFRSPRGTCLGIPAGAENYGERTTFVGCTFYNSAVAVSQGWGYADTYLIGCSVDFCKRMLTVSGGSVSLVSCHLEASQDDDYYWFVSGDGSLLQIAHSQILSVVPHRAFELGYSDASVGNGGLELSDCFVEVPAYERPTLVAGAGRVAARNITCRQSGVSPPVSAVLGAVRGRFDSVSDLAGWTQYGMDRATIDTSTKQAGTGAVKFAVSSPGRDCSIRADTVMHPQQRLAVSYYVRSSGLGAAKAAFTVDLIYQDRKGNALRAQRLHRLTADQPFTLTMPHVESVAPAGTASARIALSTDRWQSTTPAVWVDELVVNVV
jgi:hypothetical protein